MLKYVVAIFVTLGVITPALAGEFWIVRGPDKKCIVVEKKPVEKTIVVIGDKAYVTKEEAEGQIKVVCKD